MSNFSENNFERVKRIKEDIGATISRIIDDHPYIECLRSQYPDELFCLWRLVKDTPADFFRLCGFVPPHPICADLAPYHQYADVRPLYIPQDVNYLLPEDFKDEDNEDIVVTQVNLPSSPVDNFEDMPPLERPTDDEDESKSNSIITLPPLPLRRTDSISDLPCSSTQHPFYCTCDTCDPPIYPSVEPNFSPSSSPRPGAPLSRSDAIGASSLMTSTSSAHPIKLNISSVIPSLPK